MRTYDEIIEFYEKHKQQDYLGTYAGDLLLYLPWEKIIPYVKDDSPDKKEEWEKDRSELTDEAVKKELVGYLDFAFGKAYGGRGISSSRSIEHFASWLFLLGDDELFNFATDDRNYPMYGIPVLNKIRAKYAPEYTKYPEDEYNAEAIEQEYS